MGRPRIEIDFDQFKKLCEMQCTLQEIAGFFDCSEDTIERWCKRELEEPFAEAFKKYSAKGRTSLRRYQFKLAEKEITDKGYVVINPAWLPKGLDRNRYMPICMAMVDAADAIYMMDGWEDSKGARLEKAYAEYQDKLVLYERSEDGAEN